MIRYRLHQILRDGTEWTSYEAFEARHDHDLRRAIVAGLLLGSRRWATEEGTGRFLDGLDARKRSTGSEMPHGSPLSACPCYLADRTVYSPAVRIYNPAPALRLEPIRGMSHIRLAFDGDRCVGWVEV